MFDGGVCKLREIYKENFKGLTHLQALYLHYNQIDELKVDVFEEIPEITYIDLSNNKVSSLPLGIFDTLHQLRYIGLGQNQLTTIDKDIFSKNSFLMNIFLQKNKISKLQVFHKHLKYLEKVTLAHNLCIDGNFDSGNLTKLEIEIESKCKGGEIVMTQVIRDINGDLINMTQVINSDNNLNMAQVIDDNNQSQKISTSS